MRRRRPSSSAGSSASRWPRWDSRWIADPSVNYVATAPGPFGDAVAFAAEATISFVLMLVVLSVSNQQRLSPFTGAVVAILVALHYGRSAPFSGMSMNQPARWSRRDRRYLAQPLDLFRGAATGHVDGGGDLRACSRPSGGSMREFHRQRDAFSTVATRSTWPPGGLGRPAGGTIMASDTHYDIIIIGTGAGGAHHMRLHHPASASSSSNAATTCVVKKNWSSRAVNVDALSHAGSVAGQGRQGIHTNYYVGGNTSSTAPPSSGCASATTEIHHHGGVSPAWPISYEDLEPYALAPNACRRARSARRGSD